MKNTAHKDALLEVLEEDLYSKVSNIKIDGSVVTFVVGEGSCIVTFGKDDYKFRFLKNGKESAGGDNLSAKQLRAFVKRLV